MGGSSTPVGSTEQLLLTDPQKGQLAEAYKSFQRTTGNANTAALQAAQGTQTNFSQYGTNLNSNFAQYNPNLNTEFKAPTQLDDFSRALLGQGAQDQNNRLNAQQAQFNQQFRGSNVGRVLGAQAAVNSQLATNPLTLQAGIAQQQRDSQNQQLTNQARLAQSQQGSQLQQLGNATQLQQSENSANLAGLGNSALAQRFQLQSQPMQNQQNLLATLAGILGLTGARSNTPINPNGTPATGRTGNIAEDYFTRK